MGGFSWLARRPAAAGDPTLTLSSPPKATLLWIILWRCSHIAGHGIARTKELPGARPNPVRSRFSYYTWLKALRSRAGLSRPGAQALRAWERVRLVTHNHPARQSDWGERSDQPRPT